MWFARVPTNSNVSDAPSRGSDSELLELGSVRSTIKWKDLLKGLGTDDVLGV